jgi:hypothetical protein
MAHMVVTPKPAAKILLEVMNVSAMVVGREMEEVARVKIFSQNV